MAIAEPHRTIVDAHSDLLMELAHAERVHGEENPFATRWLEPLRAGGVAMQVCAIYVESTLGPDEGLREILRLARCFRTAVEANPDDVFAIESRADLDRVGTDGRIGLMLALEGVAAFGDQPWLIDVLADLGVRMAGLTWNERNAFATGCDHPEGMTPLGVELVERMLRRGVVLDLAHASPRTLADGLAVVGDAPVLVSHAACAAVHDHPRNLTDAQLVALADHGGLLGLMPHPLVVDPQAPTIERFADHVDHAVDTIGIEHVALGGDFMRQVMHAIGAELVTADGVRFDATIAGLEGQQDYPHLIDALAARGYDEAALAALAGANVRRLLRRGLPAT